MTYRGRRWMMAWVCGIGCGLAVGAMPIAMAQGQTAKTKAPSKTGGAPKTGGTSKTGGAKPFEFSEDDGANIGEPGVAPAKAGKRPTAGSPNGVRPGGLEKSGPEKSGLARPGAGRPGMAGGSQPNPPPNDVIPCPFKPLTRAQQKELDELLAKWEERSADIERFRCKFDRWEYDPVFGPADPDTAKTYGSGDLKYAAPDKGLFKVETLKVWTLPIGKDGKAVSNAPGTYEVKPGVFGDHWICDGKSVFEFDHKQKVLKKHPLPEEMQGKKIVDGPLPFLFGAKAEVLKQRYWMRIVTPDDVTDQHWMEAYPKYLGDRQNFLKVTVILSSTEFLPDAMEVCDPSFRPKVKEIRTVYQFKNREVNWEEPLLSKLNLFHREFFEPKVPSGWTLKVQDYVPPDAETVQRPQPPAKASSTKSKKG